MIQLRGAAAGLSFLHSCGIVHGSGESDRSDEHARFNLFRSQMRKFPVHPRENPLTRGV